MFKVVVDRSHAMVNLTAEGFITVEELERAAAALHDSIRSLGDRAGRHLTLYDLTRLNVVAGPVLAKFGSYFTDPVYRAIWARRVALVTASPMVARQMARLRGERSDMRIFDDRTAAMAWLLAAGDDRSCAMA